MWLATVEEMNNNPEVLNGLYYWNEVTITSY